MDTVSLGFLKRAQSLADLSRPRDGRPKPPLLLGTNIHGAMVLVATSAINPRHVPRSRHGRLQRGRLASNDVDTDRDLLAAHHALVKSDSPFQRATRLRQALWRERVGYPIGLHRGRPLGSRVAMPFAKETLANYLTETVRSVVRHEVIHRPSDSEQVYQEPRIFDDLLSSQPLCFNLFGELQQDRALASRIVGELMDEPGAIVTAVRFEYSPGRGDPAFTADHSAFDVFVEYEAVGGPGFLGIEVKYVENMAEAPARSRPRYQEVARTMGCFNEDRLSELRGPRLEQIWRDHLLAGSLIAHPTGGFATGKFVVLYPEGNEVVSRALSRYRASLTHEGTFSVWTLERFLRAATRHGGGDWASSLEERYLGGPVD